jgi:hypothetical protein
MSMMDFQSALTGGGGAPPDIGGPPGGPPPGLPPDLGAPPPPEPAAEEEPVFNNSLEALDAAEDALHSFIQLDPDEADRAAAAKCLQEVIKLKAANQQSAQSGDLKSLQRALSGGPGAGGPGY